MVGSASQPRLHTAVRTRVVGTAPLPLEDLRLWRCPASPSPSMRLHFSNSFCLLLPPVILDPGAASRQGLAGERWLCPLWVFLSKNGSSLKDRDGIHQQMTWDTGVLEQVSGKQ